MKIRQAMRAAVASGTAAAFLLAGCSKAVRVPDTQLVPATEWEGKYHVITKTDQFTTRHFSVTDSTLVITRLDGSDKHYAHIQLPVGIPLGDVKSVERYEPDHVRTALLVAGIVAGALIVTAIGLSQASASAGFE